MRKWIVLVFLAAVGTAGAAAALADSSSIGVSPVRSVGVPEAGSPGDGYAPIPGTVITMRNWQRYRGYMSTGMQALFEGKYFWKMPADVQIEVGPTVIDPLPRNYLLA